MSRVDTEVIDFSQEKSFKNWLLSGVSRHPEVETKDGLKIVVNHPDKLQAFIQSTKPALFILSGTSESGKSHMGKKLLEEGRAHRVKFVHAVSIYQEEFQTNVDLDPLSFVDSLQSERDREKLMQHVQAQLQGLVEKSGIPSSVIETIKHPWVVEMFERTQDFRTLSLFVDAPLSSRIFRESLKTGLTQDEVMASILEKDKSKNEYGNTDISRIATITVENDGSLFAYNNLLTAFSEIALDGKQPAIGQTIEYSKKPS